MFVLDKFFVYELLTFLHCVCCFGLYLRIVINPNFAYSNVECIINLQECLNGEFVRVGPNPKFSPVAGYHWYGL